ncbi:MAG TPA: T9SS type A sorting domain-containing protein [Flavipsychrobacter sp.]
MQKKSVILLAISLLLLLNIKAQDLVWVKQIGNAGGTILDIKHATDAAGNIYATGAYNGTVDFDPGNGVNNLTPTKTTGVFIQKLDPSGALVWAKQVEGSKGGGIYVDAAGNVYVTGQFFDTSDLDPGPGTLNLTSAGAGVFVLKLNSSGNLVWAKGIAQTYSTDLLVGIKADATGNVYIAGSHRYPLTDFDPGPGVVTLNVTTEQTYVLKLNISGDFAWVRAIECSSPAINRPYDMDVDASGNVYVTGDFTATVDADPGPGIANLTSGSGYNIYVWKLTTAGNLGWAKGMGTTNSSRSWGASIVADNTGNVYTTGLFQGNSTFGTFALTGPSATTEFSTFMVKQNVSGDVIWANMLGPSGNVYGSHVEADATGVYYTGSFESTIDFDPGTGTANMVPAGNADQFILHLDTGANFNWVRKMGGASASVNPYTLNIDATKNVYTSGLFSGTVDFDPGPAVTNLSSPGNFGFIHKMNTPSFIGNINKGHNLDVYPNPASDILVVDIPSDGELILFDIIGSEVLRKTVRMGKQNVGLNDLQAGTYVLYFSDTTGGAFAQKIVKN